MARNDPQMNLRVPMELKEKIEKAALDNGRTITAEAVYRLEQSFENPATDPNDFQSLVKAVQENGRLLKEFAENQKK